MYLLITIVSFNHVPIMTNIPGIIDYSLAKQSFYLVYKNHIVIDLR